MSVNIQTKSIDEIYEDMIDQYTKGEYLDGCTSYGEDALMGPDKFADRFQHICFGSDTERQRSYQRRTRSENGAKNIWII